MYRLLTKIGILVLSLTSASAYAANSVSVCEDYSYSDLYQAARSDKLSLLQTMLSCPGASINGNGYTTPLIGAINGSAINTFNYLIKAGADINLASAPFMAIEAVDYAPSPNADKILETLLLDKRLDVTANFNGATLLMLAVKAGHAGAVEALLSREGIDINASTRSGMTALIALHLAVQNDKSPQELIKILNLLLNQKDIQVNATDSMGWDIAWHLSEKVNGSVKYLELAKVVLTSKKLNVNKYYTSTNEPTSHATLLMWFPYSGGASTEVVKTLIARDDTDLFLKDEKGRTAYDRAVGMGQTEAAKLLREAMDRKKSTD